MNDTILQVMLDTGERHLSVREDVPDRVITALLPWMRSTLRSGTRERLPLPGAPCTAFAEDAEGCLALNIAGPAGPLMCVFVAIPSCGAGSLWSRLGGAGAPPQINWCATRVLSPIATDYETAEWLANFGQCVAWAWVLHYETHRLQNGERMLCLNVLR